jgi:heptosyltransferase-2
LEGHEIHWFVSESAKPLMERVPGISLVRSDLREADFRDFELVLNLERTSEALEATNALPRDRRIGFVPGLQGPILRSAGGRECTILDWKRSLCAQGKPYWQQWLFALLGEDWNGEPYRLNAPKVPVSADFGLNWRTGTKWRDKTLPFSSWKEFAEELGRIGTVSWQEGFDQLDQYVRWIASCRTVVTHDSSGLHLALALRKRVIAYFGQPNESEVHLYGLGEKILFGAAEAHAAAYAATGV